jgi:hypothetical protein
MKFSPNQLSLEAGQSSQVNFTIDVPADPTLNGSYWGLLFVANEMGLDEAMKNEKVDKPVLGIRTVFRYVTQINVHIAGTATPSETKFSDIKIEADPHNLTLLPVVESKGNSIARMKGWVELRNKAGQLVYKSEEDKFSVLPDSKRLWKFRISDQTIEAGEYVALVIADIGKPELIAAQARLTIDTTITPYVPGTEPSEESPAVVTTPAVPADS